LNGIKQRYFYQQKQVKQVAVSNCNYADKVSLYSENSGEAYIFSAILTVGLLSFIVPSGEQG